MADNVIEFQDTRTSWEKFKGKVSEKYEKTKAWCKEHKEIVLAVAPVVISGAFELVRTGMKYHDKQEERQLERDRMCSEYDRSLGSYVETTRPLTNDDKREIQRMKREGMTRIEALEEMGLLK